MTIEQLEKEIFGRRFEMYEEALKVFSNDLPEGKKVYGLVHVTGICVVSRIFILNNFEVSSCELASLNRNIFCRLFTELFKYEPNNGDCYFFKTDADRVTALKEMLTHKPK